MKQISILATVIFAIGCSLLITNCNVEPCTPPDANLSAATLKWFSSYENNDYSVFKNTAGETDSLQVNRVSETQFCGGEECGTNDCQYEKAVLTSTRNADVIISLTANSDTDMHINDLVNTGNYMSLGLNADNSNINLINNNITASIDDNYDWKGENLSVLKIDCSGSCDNYEMKNIVISKSKGLIKYTTKGGIEWEKVN